MLFGRSNNTKFYQNCMFVHMRTIVFSFFALVLVASACDTTKKAGKFRFATPEPGTIVNKGNTVPLKLIFPNNNAIDSVVYTLDGQVIASKTDSGSVSLDTETISLGNRTLSARLYQQGEELTAHSNIVVLPQPPQRYGFEVVNEFPHDPQAFTQGLEYENGILYESTGQTGRSTLRRVNYQTGEVLQRISMANDQFGEGLTVVGDRIIQLTWLNGIGLVYNKNTFQKTGEFSYGESKEGWGICFDGERLIKSDGTNRLYFLNKDTYAEEGFVEVFNHRGAVDQLNELEYIDGKVFANVYQQDIIVIIDPNTGVIEGEINLIGIYPEKESMAYDNELNGIAYDRANDRLFVTGKNWSKLFEIKLVKR